MENNFRLTSSEYAKLRDLSVEALRSRRRRELERGNFICVDGKYWWKNDRPIEVNKKINSRPIPGPRSLLPVARYTIHGTRKRNRGALARGEKPDYPNWKMEDHNRVLALAKIRNELGDEVCDEIAPEMFEMAKKKIAERKQKEVEKTLNKNVDPGPGIPIGIDRTNPKYGSMLNATGLKSIEDREHAFLGRKWFHNLNFNSGGGSSNSMFFGTFGKSLAEEKGSVEIDPRDFTPDDREPEFRNKIEEDIWRLKNRK